MTSDLEASAIPGWYDDPEAPDLLRWWDGANWSDTEFQPKTTDGWRTNEIGNRARTLFFWALGVGVLLWVVPIALTFVPSAEAQTLGVILAWVGFLPVLTLSILAIVFGSIGLSRARKLGGLHRRAALTGLIGGICVFAVPPSLAVLGIAVLVVLAS